jgi:hypothetical protein
LLADVPAHLLLITAEIMWSPVVQTWYMPSFIDTLCLTLFSDMFKLASCSHNVSSASVFSILTSVMALLGLSLHESSTAFVFSCLK